MIHFHQGAATIFPHSFIHYLSALCHPCLFRARTSFTVLRLPSLLLYIPLLLLHMLQRDHLLSLLYLHASPLSFSPLPSWFVKIQSGYRLLVRTLSVWKQQGAQRSPFREEKNKYKHVKNTSTFTLHTTSSVCMRSIGMQTAACHHAHKQINNTGNKSNPLAQCSPHFVFHSLPLLWCSHLSCPPAGTDFLSPTHSSVL